MTTHSVNRVAMSILVSCLLSLLALAGGLLFMANAQNEQSLHAERKLIESGMVAQGDTLTRLNREYSGWTPFFTAILQNQYDWLYENVATTVTETQNFDMVVLFDAKTEPVYAWDITTAETSDLSIIDPGLVKTVKAYVASAPNNEQQDKLQYMTLRGKPALVSFARVVTTDKAALPANDPKPALAIAYYLSDERIKKIGDQLFISDLKLEFDKTGEAITLADSAGNAVGILNWTPARLGTDTLVKILLPLCLLAFLPFAASIFLTLRARNQTNAALESERQARAEAVASQQAALQSEKMAQLGNLTATVAHEIRNPLGSVRTTAFLLRRKYAEKMPEMAPLLDRIENGVSRCDATIFQLLDYARSRHIAKNDVVLDDFIVKVATEQSQKLPEGITVECDLSLGTRRVGIDADRFERVLINLMSNAAEAITTQKDRWQTDARIIIATRSINDDIEISVADTGPGIAPADMDKILSPMYTTKSFGTGLGLSAVYNIVEKHGGKMRFENRAEGGAIFTITLPPLTAANLTEAA